MSNEIFQTFELFEASKLKLLRAKQHIDELRGAIKTYTDSVPFEVVVEDDEDMHDLVIRLKQEPPKMFAAIIGDVIHNLRTPLDLMACDLARLAGFEKYDDVSFPFAKDKDSLSRQIKKKNFDKAGPEAVEFLKELKPFKGGNLSLRFIHDLDILDKHRAIIPVMHMGRLITDTPSFRNCSFSRPVFDGAKLLLIPKSMSDFHSGQRLSATFVLQFMDMRKAGLPYDEEIVAGLEKLLLVVEEIVAAFEKLSVNRTPISTQPSKIATSRLKQSLMYSSSLANGLNRE